MVPKCVVLHPWDCAAPGMWWTRAFVPPGLTRPLIFIYVWISHHFLASRPGWAVVSGVEHKHSWVFLHMEWRLPRRTLAAWGRQKCPWRSIWASAFQMTFTFSKFSQEPSSRNGDSPANNTDGWYLFCSSVTSFISLREKNNNQWPPESIGSH